MTKLAKEAIKVTGISGGELLIRVDKDGYLICEFSQGRYYVLLETKALFNILTIMIKARKFEADYALLAWYGFRLNFNVNVDSHNCTLSVMEQEDLPPHEFKKEPIITLDKEQIISFIEFLSDKELN